MVGAIKNGASQIENDQDLAAFKGLMVTVITIGMGVAGVGGPAGWTCGGGCCHGQNGTAGMVRINYKIADP